MIVASSTGFPAPPARQAIECLAGKFPAYGRDGALDVSQVDFDLPLTRYFRRNAHVINRMAIVAAASGAAAFGLPFLILLAR